MEYYVHTWTFTMYLYLKFIWISCNCTNITILSIIVDIINVKKKYCLIFTIIIIIKLCVSWIVPDIWFLIIMLYFEISCACIIYLSFILFQLLLSEFAISESFQAKFSFSYNNNKVNYLFIVIFIYNDGELKAHS